jgi:Domain of unknown function (DUF4150)
MDWPMHHPTLLITCGHGDEPGTSPGVGSGTVGGVKDPKTHAGSVRVEKQRAIRHNDEWWMNNRNTVGKLTYVRNTSPFDETPAVMLYRERPENQIIRAEVELPDTGTITDLPPILDGGAPPAVPNGDPLPPAPLPSEGLPTPDNPPPSAVTRWLGRIARSPAIAKEVADYITNGSVTVRQIENMIAELEYYRDDFTAKGYTPEQLSQYDDAIANLNRLKEQTEHANRTDSHDEAEERRDEAMQDFLDLELGSGDVRVTDGDPPDPCKIGPYSEMRDICRASGAQAHHIVPDYTLRYGTRVQGEAGIKRIPDMPTFGDGNAICLAGNAATPKSEHNIAQTYTDNQIRDLSKAPDNPIPGTVQIGDVMDAAITGASKAKPDCAAQIEAAVQQQFGSLPENRLLRGTKYRIPRGPALEAISPDD